MLIRYVGRSAKENERSGMNGIEKGVREKEEVDIFKIFIVSHILPFVRNFSNNIPNKYDELEDEPSLLCVIGHIPINKSQLILN